MILAFARTTAAFVARRKRVTRREWTDSYHALVKRKLEEALDRGERGLIMDAWSAGPHRGGKSIGKLLLKSLTREHTCKIPDSDWEEEGFAYMQANGLDLGGEETCAARWAAWRSDPDQITSVLRFEVESINEAITEAEFLPGRRAV